MSIKTINTDLKIQGNGTSNGNVRLSDGAAIGHLPVVALSANATLTYAQRGKLIDVASAGVITLTLPSLAGGFDGVMFIVRNSGTANVTLARSSTDTVDGATSLVLFPGEFTILAGDTTVAPDRWHALTYLNTTPTARIVRTSKIALTAAFSGLDSVVGSHGNTLVYSWAATGSAIIATQAASTTTMTFPVPGAYTITLTVTDSHGATDSTTHTLNVERTIEINGADLEINDLFSTLASVLAWITGHGGTSSTTKYLIRAFDTVTDVSTVVMLSYVTLQLMPGALLNFTHGGVQNAVTLANQTDTWIIGDGSGRVQIEMLAQSSGGAYALVFSNSTDCGATDLCVGGFRSIVILTCPTPVRLLRCTTMPFGDTGIGLQGHSVSLPTGERHLIEDCDIYGGAVSNSSSAALSITYTLNNQTLQLEISKSRVYGYGYNDGLGTANHCALAFFGASAPSTADIYMHYSTLLSNGIASVSRCSGIAPGTKTSIFFDHCVFRPLGSAVPSFSWLLNTWTAAEIWMCLIGGGFGANVTPVAGAGNVIA